MLHPRLKEIVRDIEWQRIRESFLGTWKTQAVENVRTLRNYLGDISKLHPDDPKFVRVYNYIACSGFRSKKIQHPDVTKLHHELKAISQAHKKGK